jgi:hypothetical protein
VASADAIAQSEQLCALLEDSVAGAADVASAVGDLQKQEELLKLKESLHDAMVRSVDEQCELAVASAMTTFEETRLAPKLTGLTKDLQQSLVESATALEQIEDSLRNEISDVQSLAQKSSVDIEAWGVETK